MFKFEQFSKRFDEAIMVHMACNKEISVETLQLLSASSKHGNLKVFRDMFNRPIGYIVWSKISKQTLRMMSFNAGSHSYPYELNDGHIPLLETMLFVRPTNTDYSFLWKTNCSKKRLFLAKRKNGFYAYIRTKGRFNRKKLFDFGE